jgi:hypothetical protein
MGFLGLHFANKSIQKITLNFSKQKSALPGNWQGSENAINQYLGLL